jgi:hypothetical protein
MKTKEIKSLSIIEKCIDKWQNKKRLNLTIEKVKEIANNISKNKCLTNN